MAGARAKRQREAEERKRMGCHPMPSRAPSAANRRSPMERNPQVRLSCEGLPAARLTDRPRAASVGRLLFVFDSPEQPLRHISYQRTIADSGAGRGRARRRRRRLREDLGPPTRKPQPTPAGQPPPARPADRPHRHPALAGPHPNTSGPSPTSPSASPPSTSAAPAAPCSPSSIEVPLPIRPDAPARSYAGR